MGTGTLVDRAAGQTIQDVFFNSIHSSIKGDFVGRDSSGSAILGQNLGTNSIPWGSAFITSLILNGSSVDASLLAAPQNRIVSGKARSASNQPQFIDPNGAAASFVLEATTTNLIIDVNGVTVTFANDVTKSSLTVGPSTTATALVDDTDAADQESTKTWGERFAEKETITVDTMGAEFQTFIGQWVIVEITGVATEYALVFVKSATELTDAYRGFFTDSSSNPINRTGFTDGDTITVLSTGWVFAENDGATVDVSYTNPIRSFTAPSGPATGDYWLNFATNNWNRYDGATFQIINRTLVGVVGVDSANCVAARSFDFFAKYEDTNNIELDIQSTSIIENRNQSSKINVYGNEFDLGFNHETWNITTDLAASTDMYNASEQASTDYYLFLKDTGETVLSDISPYFRPDLIGYYHPHNPWRCVGVAFNDSGSDFSGIRFYKFNSLNRKDLQNYRASDHAGFGSTNTVIPYYTNIRQNEGQNVSDIRNDSTDGFSITAKEVCIVKASYSLNSPSSGSQTVGWSINSSELTTQFNGINDSNRIIKSSNSPTPGENYTFETSVNIRLNINDVLRPHTEGAIPSATQFQYINIVVESEN